MSLEGQYRAVWPLHVACYSSGFCRSLSAHIHILISSFIRRPDPEAAKEVRECVATMVRDHFLMNVRSVKQVFIMEDGTIRGMGVLHILVLACGARAPCPLRLNGTYLSSMVRRPELTTTCCLCPCIDDPEDIAALGLNANIGVEKSRKVSVYIGAVIDTSLPYPYVFFPFPLPRLSPITPYSSPLYLYVFLSCCFASHLSHLVCL